jgi:predicted nucleic acid-binding protein
MYILDTDVIIWLLRKKKDVIQAIMRASEKGELFLSTATVAEVYKNAFENELKETEVFLKKHTILPLDYEIAKQAGTYWKDWNKKYKTLGLIDCIIASTAKQNNLRLITYNTKHYPMRDIVIISPTDLL